MVIKKVRMEVIWTKYITAQFASLLVAQWCTGVYKAMGSIPVSEIFFFTHPILCYAE